MGLVGDVGEQRRARRCRPPASDSIGARRTSTAPARPAAARLRRAWSTARGSTSTAIDRAPARAPPRPGPAGPSRSRRRAPGRRAGPRAPRGTSSWWGGRPGRSPRRAAWTSSRTPAGAGRWAGLRRYQPAIIAAGGSGQPGTSARGRAGKGHAASAARGGLGRAARRADHHVVLAAHRLQRAEVRRRHAARRVPGDRHEPARGQHGGLARLGRRGPHRPLRAGRPRRRGPAPGRRARPRRAPGALRATHATALAAAGTRSSTQAVAEVGQPRRFAARELELGARPARRPARPGRGDPRRGGPGGLRDDDVLEWAPYGVVLGWHAANSPVWVPTLVAASALVGGNAVLGPALLARAAHHRAGARGARAGLARRTRSRWSTCRAPRPSRWSGTRASTPWSLTPRPRTCKRQLAGLGRAYAAGARLRPYIPEGSGNDAMIVLAGADLDAAAEAAALGGFANGGQLCMAAKRIIVERAAWEGFRARAWCAAVAALRLGDPDDPATDVAPLRRGRVPAAEARDGARRGPGGAAGRCWWARASAGPYFTPTVVRPAARGASGRSPSGARRPSRRCAAWSWPRTPRTPWRSPTTPPSRSARRSSAPARRSCRACARRGCSLNEGPLYQDAHFVVGGVGDSGVSGARPKIEQLVWARRVHRAAG